MAKIKLGATPKTFKAFPVKFTLPDGEAGQITATFKYRTRAQFGQMLNDMFADAGEARTEDKVDFKGLFEKMGDKNADHLMASIEAWDLDTDLSRDALLQLSNEIPAAAAALMAAYNTACTEGRLGN
jgi:hypothetical protein